MPTCDAQLDAIWMSCAAELRAAFILAMQDAGRGRSYDGQWRDD